jgi:transposase
MGAGPDVRISEVERVDGGWTVSATLMDGGRCPSCDAKSTQRHGWYVRHLQDLPAQGAAVRLRLKLARWRCVNLDCARRTFGDRSPAVAQPYVRRTDRVAELARLVTHMAGGRPARRLMTRIGAPQSKDTLLRALKRSVRQRACAPPVRVVGVDDWSWRKGAPTERSWSTWNVARFSIFCRIGLPSRPPTGSGAIRPLKW